MVRGREAIGAMCKGNDVQASGPELTALDVKMIGPAAVREIGIVSLKTKSATPQELTGKYVVVWDRVSTDWKIATDIWNDGK